MNALLSYLYTYQVGEEENIQCVQNKLYNRCSLSYRKYLNLYMVFSTSGANRISSATD